MAEPKKHTSKTARFNEDLLKYIIDSVYYPDELPDGGGMMNTEDFSTLIGDARTYREARNRILNALETNPELLDGAISDFNDDYGNPDAGIVYNKESFDKSKSKMEPILSKDMKLGDVDYFTEQLALALGYNDNNDAGNGARKSLLNDIYAGEGGVIKSLKDAHPTEYQFSKESGILAKKIKERIQSEEEVGNFLRALGFNPSLTLDEVLKYNQGIPSMVERSYAAYARDKNMPMKALSVLEGIAAPQTAASLNDGRTPSITDVGTDAAEAYLLGKAKTAKAILENGKFLNGVVKAAATEAGIDLAHDAVDELTKDIVYSEGDYPITGGGDVMSLADPYRVSGAVQAALFGGLGRKAIPIAKKVASKGADGKVPDSVFGKLTTPINEANERVASLTKDLKNVEKITREINQARKKNGRPIVTKEEVRQNIEAELKDAEAQTAKAVINRSRGLTAMQLFGKLGTIAGTRAAYNGNVAPNIFQLWNESKTPQK